MARTSRRSTLVDLAPKTFAARIGWMIALLMVLTHGPAPLIALACAWMLVVFALLEGLAGFCVGCLVYSAVMLPWIRRIKKSP